MDLKYSLKVIDSINNNSELKGYLVDMAKETLEYHWEEQDRAFDEIVDTLQHIWENDEDLVKVLPGPSYELVRVVADYLFDAALLLASPSNMDEAREYAHYEQY